jgi:hypothetical protein
MSTNAAKSSRRYTVEEYLQIQREAFDGKREYVDGEIRLMSGASLHIIDAYAQFAGWAVPARLSPERETQCRVWTAASRATLRKSDRLTRLHLLGARVPKIPSLAHLSSLRMSPQLALFATPLARPLFVPASPNHHRRPGLHRPAANPPNKGILIAARNLVFARKAISVNEIQIRRSSKMPSRL